MNRLKIAFKPWTVPLALLALCAVSYIIMIPKLGFYWDDWSPILVYRAYGLQAFWKFYAFDRPTSAWVYILFTSLLGVAPLGWQLTALFFRWLASVSLWWFISRLWPRSRHLAVWAALLFVVYPVFSQQAIAVTYLTLWIEYSAFLISMACMVEALRQPKWYWVFTTLSILTVLLYLSVSEYFLGVELLRPILILLLVSRQSVDSPQQKNLAKRLLTTLRYYLPYLVVVASFIIWRLFFMHIEGGDPNHAYLFFALFSKPLSTLRQLLQMLLQDTTRTLITSWVKAFDPTLLDLSRGFYLLTWAATAVVAAATAGYLILFKEKEQADPVSTDPVSRSQTGEILMVAALALLLGPLPAWITGRTMTSDPATDRYAAAAMFGASLLFVGLLEWLTPRRLQKIIILSVMVGLAVGIQLRYANDFRWFWTYQTRFAWQLSERIPSLKSPTAIISADDIFPQQGRFATSAALNLIYPQAAQPADLKLWVIPLRGGYLDKLLGHQHGMNYDESFRIFTFKGSSRNSLVIDYSPLNEHCLWVLDETARENPGLPEEVRLALPLSNLSQIADQRAAGYPPSTIFGKEQKNSWCYFFEKADLARQNSDWSEAAQLGDQAKAAGYSPTKSGSRMAFEWLPFIEAYANLNRWNDARDLSLSILAAKKQVHLEPMFCRLWQRIQVNAPDSPEKKAASQAVMSKLNCTKP